MQLNTDIELAIRNHKEIISIKDFANEEDIRNAIRWVMRNNPDIFGFAHQYTFDNEHKRLVLKYQFSKERSRLIQKSINDVIEHDFQIAYVRSLDVYERVAYIYKWLLFYCNYNINSAYNQTIGSVFVRRNSVCTGYAKAAQYLFKLLGIDSKLVFGQLNNDSGNGRHCWNVVFIKGEYYHIDVCLGDSELEKVLNGAGASNILNYCGVNWNCFCVSDKEIKKTRSIEHSNDMPICKKSISWDKIVTLYNIPILKKEGSIGCLLSNIGSTADIYLCKVNKTVVLKKFRKDNSNCLEEYTYMDKLRGCEHLLQVKETHSDIKQNTIEQATPIVDLFLSRYFHPTLADVLLMICDVIKGWQECYKRGIFYRDIHICNIYKADNGIYKLGDFGSCCVKPGMKERVGNVWFMSPETYTEGIFDESSAVYSITSLLFFILNDLHPAFVDDNNENTALYKKWNGEVLPLPTLLYYFSDQQKRIIMNKLIKKGCAYNRADRFASTNDLFNAITSLLNEDKKMEWSKPIFLQNPNDIRHCSTIFFESHNRVKYTSDGIDSCCLTIMPNSVESVENYCRTMGVFPPKQSKATQKDKNATYISLPNDRRGLNSDATIRHSFFSSFRRNIRGLCRLFKHKGKTEKFDIIYSSIFAPSEIKRKAHMLVQVYLHLFEETEQIKALAIESQKNAIRRDYVPLQCKINKGDRVDITLNIYGETLLMSETKSVIWLGHFTKCSFDYFVPKNIDVEELRCVTLMTINDIPIGESRFINNIVESPQALNTEIISHRYSKIFISYTHKDEWKVKSFHEGLKLMGVEHFFDRAYLKAGNIYPKIIQDYINSADLFVLFWSENALNSEYVEKERTQALKRAFPQIRPRQAAPLSIYPMNIEPYADLPIDMKDYYHFGEL